MAFIGNTPTTQAFTPAVDVFSGNGSTTAFTLSRPVASVAQVQAFIENVPQSPVDAFTVSGNTITFTSAPPSGSSNIYVRYTSPITQVISPTDGSVGTNQLVNGAVTSAKLASGAARANFGAGAVLQVVGTSSSTQVLNNTSTYADVGLSVSITPSSTSNKILVQATIPWALGTNNGGAQMQFRILRGATELASNIVYNNVSAIVQLGGTQVLSWLDSPSSTSALTYNIQFRELSMSGRYGNTMVMPTLNASQYGMMQALEIAG